MMNCRMFMKEKWVRMAKSAIFWAEPVSGTGTKEWYRYQRVVPVPIVQKKSGTGIHWQ